MVVHNVMEVPTKTRDDIRTHTTHLLEEYSGPKPKVNPARQLLGVSEGYRKPLEVNNPPVEFMEFCERKKEMWILCCVTVRTTYMNK